VAGCVVALAACGTGDGPQRPILPPTDTAAVFAPGTISTEAPEFGATFTPDGLVVYFNRTSGDRQFIELLESRFDDGEWSVPTPVAFADGQRNVDPFITADGARLYFSSTRPTMPDDSTGDYNTWYVDRTDSGWSEPTVLGDPVDTESQEVFVSLDRDRNLFFASNRDGVQRIYRSAWADGRHGAPEAVEFDLNLADGGGNPLVTPDGRRIVFVSTAEGGLGGADLYVSCQTSGTWSPAVNLGPDVNSRWADFAPAITPDGRYLIFTSERPGIVAAVPEGERPPGDLLYVPLARVEAMCGA
jgi:Tol biopolymer transport system component